MASGSARDVKIFIDKKEIGSATSVEMTTETSEEYEVRDWSGSRVAAGVDYHMKLDVELSDEARRELEAAFGPPTSVHRVTGDHVHIARPPRAPRAARTEEVPEIVKVRVLWDASLGQYVLAVNLKFNDPLLIRSETVGAFCDPLVIHEFLRQMEETETE